MIEATWALNELTSPSAGDYHYTEEYDPNETWTYDETPNPPLQQYHLEAYAKAKPHIMKALMDSNQKDLSAIDKIDDETWKTDEEHKSDPLGTYDIQEYVNTVHTFWTEIQKALDSESPAINRRVTELNDEITSIFDKKQYPADWKVVFRVTGDEAHMDAPLMKSQKKRSYRANKRALAGSAIARSTDYSIRGLQIRTQLIVERRPGSRVCDIVDEFEAQMIPHAPHIEDFKAETNRLRSAPKPITFLRIEHVASPKGTPPPNRFPVSYCQVRVVVGKVEKSLWACRTELRALLKPKAADSAINRVYKEEGFPTPWDPMLGVKLPSSIRPLLRPALNQSLSNRPTSLIPGPNLGLKRHPQQGGSFQKEDILRMIDLLQSMLI